VYLPEPALDLLQLPQNAEDEQVRIKIDALNSAHFDGLLASPESRDCFFNCLANVKQLEKFNEFPISEGLATQRKWSISVNQIEFLEVLAFPNSLVAPPLEIEEWIFHLFLNQLIPHLDAWRAALSGKGITVHHKGKKVDQKDEELCHTLALGILEHSVIQSSSPLIAARGANLISHKNQHTAPTANQLLAESFREANPKWRFLSFYRTVEHVYIGSVLKQLTDNFFSSPKDAVDNASKSLATEVEQLRLVVEENDLKDRFVEFAQKFESASKRGDQLALAIQRQMRSKAVQKNEAESPDRWRVGVRYCYQVRCAIAHAGQATAFVEKYPDWRKTIESLCPPLEVAVLQLFSVELIAIQ
jgi:hypothetical protein